MGQIRAGIAVVTTVSSVEYIYLQVAADVVTSGRFKLVQDSVLTTDGGFLVFQNYIDLTYFAEDYVGYFYSF